MPDEKPKTHKRIIDAAEEAPRGVALLRASLVLLLWALLAGVVVGAGCLATLKAVDLLQEVDALHERGLAGARGTKQRDDLVLLDVEGHMVQNGVAAEALADAIQAQDGFGGCGLGH